MPSGLVPGAGIDKADVNYRQHERCSSCVHFYPMNSCDLVDGKISSESVCDHWEGKKRETGKDASFYMDEYEKGKK